MVRAEVLRFAVHAAALPFAVRAERRRYAARVAGQPCVVRPAAG